ncbi:MAG: pentapeptide repeat-containing protein [Neisseriaceae bacterium]
MNTNNVNQSGQTAANKSTGIARQNEQKSGYDDKQTRLFQSNSSLSNDVDMVEAKENNNRLFQTEEAESKCSNKERSSDGINTDWQKNGTLSNKRSTTDNNDERKTKKRRIDHQLEGADSASQNNNINIQNHVPSSQHGNSDDIHFLFLKNLNADIISFERFSAEFKQISLNEQGNLIKYYFEKINNENNTIAMIYLAHHYCYIGEELTALSYYEQSMNNNNIKGLFYYGSLKYKGDATELRKFIKFYSEVFNSNIFLNEIHQIIFQISKLYQKHEQQDQVIFWYEKAANAGNINAMYELGCLCEREDDMEKAFFWYEKAANKRLPCAMFYLGFLYEKAKNPREAISWYHKAANAGNTDALYSLGLLYEKVGKLEQAIIWYEKASELQNIKAMLKLAHLYICNSSKYNLSKGKSLLENASELYRYEPGKQALYAILAKQCFSIFTRFEDLKQPIKQQLYSAVSVVGRFGLEYLFDMFFGKSSNSLNVELITTILNSKSIAKKDILDLKKYDTSNLFSNFSQCLCQIFGISDLEKHILENELNYMQIYEYMHDDIYGIIDDERNLSFIKATLYKFKMLIGYCFSKLDLSNMEFVDNQFVGNKRKAINFANTKLMNTNFYQAKLTYVDLSNANLDEANLEQAILDNVNISGVCLARVKFNKTTLKNIILDIDQLEYIDSLELGKINLHGFIVTNKSIYEKLYQKYRLMFCDDVNSDYTSSPKDLRRMQLGFLLQLEIQEIKERGGHIEDIGEIDSVLGRIYPDILIDK